MGANSSSTRTHRRSRRSTRDSRGRNSWKRVSMKTADAYRLITPTLMLSIRDEWDIIENQEEEIKRLLTQRLLSDDCLFLKQFTKVIRGNDDNDDDDDGDDDSHQIKCESVLESHTNKFMNTIKFAITNVEDRKLFCRIIGHIGSFHAKFNNYMMHYRAIGTEFLVVLKEMLGEQFNDDSRENWRTMLEVVFKTMNEATKLAIDDKDTDYDQILADY